MQKIGELGLQKQVSEDHEVPQLLKKFHLSLSQNGGNMILRVAVTFKYMTEVADQEFLDSFVNESTDNILK